MTFYSAFSLSIVSAPVLSTPYKRAPAYSVTSFRSVYTLQARTSLQCHFIPFCLHLTSAHQPTVSLHSVLSTPYKRAPAYSVTSFRSVYTLQARTSLQCHFIPFCLHLTSAHQPTVSLHSVLSTPYKRAPAYSVTSFRSVYTLQPRTSLQCHFIPSHVCVVCMCV